MSTASAPLPEPRVSVIIPARNAAEDLERCLAALAASGQPREIIIVDDGSTDATGDVARSHGAQTIRLEGSGPATARNAGVRAARGDFLVFFDADCQPRPECLAALLAPFDDPLVAGVRGGYTSLQRSPIARFVQLELEEKQDRLGASSQITVMDTACAAYRRAAFIRYGGFDERLGPTSVEDVELSFRMAAAGERLVYAPTAVVAHRHPSGLMRYCWRKLRFGFFRARLYGRFPSRLTSDGYTPRSMPLQIACSGLLLLALLAGLWLGPARIAAATLAAAFLLLSGPLTLRARRGDRALAPAVPLLLLCRSWSQGLGLAAGGALLCAGLPRSARRGKPREALAHSPGGES